MSPDFSFPVLTPGWIFPDSLAFLTGFAVRSTLLLGAGLATGGLLRLAGCSAATRFRALWLAAAGVPLVLAGSVLADFLETPAPLRLTMPFLSLTNIGLAPVSPPTGSAAIAEAPAAAESAVVRAEQPQRPGAWKPEWLDLSGGLWLAGLGITLAGLGWRQAQAGRAVPGAAPVESGRAHRLLAEAAAVAGLRGGVPRLYFTDGWVMPGLGGGGRRPWIVLPAEAETDWEEHRLRHVLLHECGHAARGDARADFLAQLFLAAAWFHPFTWLLKRQLAGLREMACDDWVLTRGKAEPAAYAGDLLALVRRHRTARSGEPRPSRGHASTGTPPPLFGMAQQSSAGRRIRRLLRPELRRREPGRGASSGLAAGSLVLTALSIALVSCGTLDQDQPQPSRLLSGFEKDFRQIQAWSPEKPRPGAAELRFCILEISVPPGQTSFLTPWLAKDGSLPPTGSTRTLPTLSFASLRTPAQQKGVDLMSLPPTREGQEGDFRYVRNFRYPSAFDSAGKATEFTDKETGVRIKVRGEKNRDGTAVTADIEWSINTLSGAQVFPLPGGATVQQPMFESRSGGMKGVFIPNGGFTVFEADYAPLTKTEDALTPAQLARLQKTKPARRYLAVGVTSTPLPPAAAGTGPVQPVTPGPRR